MKKLPNSFILVMVLILLTNYKVQARLFSYQDKATELFGFKDSEGKVIIQPQFQAIYAPDDEELFSTKNKEYEFLVGVIKHGRMWRITQNGACKFESVFFDNGPDYYEEGLARFLKNGKVGFHDRTGSIAIEAAYDFASPFKNGFSYVCIGCHAEYPKMPKYAPLSSLYAELLPQHMILELVGGTWGIIDKKGKIIEPLIHDSLETAKTATKKHAQLT